MARQKTTSRQRDIERLTRNYQSNLSSLTPEYESIMQNRSQAITGDEQRSRDFQRRLETYQRSLEDYRRNPFEAEKIRGSFEPYAPTYQWGYVIDGNWYSAKNLPEGYVEESPTGDFALKRRSVPRFEEAPPEPTNTSQYDADLERLESRRKTLGENLQREVGERRSSRVRAVSQRSRERPMLSRGVTL